MCFKIIGFSFLSQVALKDKDALMLSIIGMHFKTLSSYIFRNISDTDSHRMATLQLCMYGFSIEHN